MSVLKNWRLIKMTKAKRLQPPTWHNLRDRPNHLITPSLQLTQVFQQLTFSVAPIVTKGGRCDVSCAISCQVWLQKQAKKKPADQEKMSACHRGEGDRNESFPRDYSYKLSNVDRNEWSQNKMFIYMCSLFIYNHRTKYKLMFLFMNVYKIINI